MKERDSATNWATGLLSLVQLHFCSSHIFFLFVYFFIIRDYVTGEMWKFNKHPYRLVLNSAAAKEIEWHVKHYMGRGLMIHYKSGRDLAAAMGIPAQVIFFPSHRKDGLIFPSVRT
jgi:hypothetical protein